MSDTGSMDTRVAPEHDDICPEIGEFLSAASFLAPDRAVSSAWIEHAPFAFWLVAALRPRRIVELGVHSGFSYFVFCQAVEHFGLEADCFGIDTWMGDEHAGFYDPQVFADVSRRNAERYGSFSRLIRSTFDEAQPHFSDGSVDLLHIDGRHFYDDVRHDFECWREKLSARSVVLFHDTNVHERGFGVARLWSELRGAHPSFEFKHGHGLGVLGFGAEIPGAMQRLCNLASEQMRLGVRAAYARLGQGLAARFELRDMAAEAARREREAEERVRAELTAELGNRNAALESELTAARTNAAERELASRAHAEVLDKHIAALRTELARVRAQVAEGQAALRARAAEEESRLSAKQQEVAAREQELSSVRLDAVGREAALRTHATNLETERNDLWRERDILLGSSSWRATAPLRLAVGSIPVPVRSQLRRGAKPFYWTVTPHRMGRRIAFLRARRQLSEDLRQTAPLAGAELADVRSQSVPLAASGSESSESPLPPAREPSATENRAASAEASESAAVLEQARLIAESDLFDPAWYLERCPEASASALDPALHYLKFGLALQRNPGPEFDALWYLERYPDVRAGKVNPLLHYLEFGMAEGREARSVGRGLPTAAQVLSRHFLSLEPLPIFSAPRQAPRLTMVTDGINAGRLYGGVGTALVLAALIARRLGARLRILTRVEAAGRDNVTHLLAAQRTAWAEDIEFLHSPPGSRREIPVGAGEIFLTTSWWTTHCVRQTVDPRRIIYLLQEDERMFYPHGDERLRCEETLRDRNIRFVINSEMLFEHLVRGPESLPNVVTNGVFFEPAFPAFAMDANKSTYRDKSNFFFYARPENLRNLYWRGLEAIQACLQEGILHHEKWNVFFCGRDLQETILPHDVRPHLVENLPWSDYADLVRNMDVGLALMETPHPSYPPLDLAAAGAVVVTNRHGLKQSLRRYSDNIVCVEPSLQGLTQGIAAAITLASDEPRRSANYSRNRIGQDWKLALQPVLDRLLPELAAIARLA